MDTPPDQNGTSKEIDKILSGVTTVLGSLETPNYSRIKADNRRYVRLIIELSGSFWIRDVSDTNTDVSSVLSLRPDCADSSEEYLLYISNVGNYAFIMAFDDSPHNSRDRLETLTSLLKRNGLESLSKDILSLPVKAMTFNSDQPRLFNILFSDTEYLPWESSDFDPEEAAANDA